MAILLGIAVAAALVWVLLTTLWLWKYQERVVFQPPRLWADAPASTRKITFTAHDGHQLHGYLLEPPSAGKKPATVVIALHGNADLSAWLVPWARELAERARVTVFLPEYRGYGGIPGTPTYYTARDDAEGALRYARAELRPDRIVLFGHSLGSAIASELAASMVEPPASLVLQSPFTSAREMAARMLVPPIPWLWRTISRVHYDTRAIVSQLDAPVWVAHGARDVVVPSRMGLQVHSAAKRRGELLMVPKAGHNDVADVAGERYWRWLTDAVSSAVAELEEEGGRRLPGLM